MYHSDSELYYKSEYLFIKGKGAPNHNIKTYWRVLNESCPLGSSNVAKSANRLSYSSNSNSDSTLGSRYEDRTEIFNYEENNHSDFHSSKSDPDCCLFVASLVSSKAENELARSVSKHFSQWGKLVDVKVMKDSMGRPYGFVQYKLKEDAKIALEKSINTIINGRHIRVEKARVNRTIFLYNLSAVKSVEQTVNMVSRFGELEDAKILNTSDVESKNCGFFKFKYREDAIKAYSYFYSHSTIAVEWATFLEKTHRVFDFSSIFIGNLPANITRNDLEQRFKAYGDIIYIHIFPRGATSFSFIKFKDYNMSIKAIEAQNGAVIKENSLKVFFRKIRFKQQNKFLNESNFFSKYYCSPKYNSTQSCPYEDTYETIDRGSENNDGKGKQDIKEDKRQNANYVNPSYHKNYNRCNMSTSPEIFQQTSGYSCKPEFNDCSKRYNCQRKNSDDEYQDHESSNFSYSQQIIMPFTPYLNPAFTDTSQSAACSPQTPLFYPPYSPYFSTAISGNNNTAGMQYSYYSTPILKQLPDGSYAPMASYPNEYYSQRNSNVIPQYQVPPSPLMLPPPQVSSTPVGIYHSIQRVNNEQSSNGCSTINAKATSILNRKPNISSESKGDTRPIYGRKL
jgi:RNA recognition motif-containing protein